MSLTERPLEQFLEELASHHPTPGGGSVAALMGAMAAALISMVARLTLGKRGYEAVESEMEALLGKADSIRDRLREAMEADVRAFNEVMAAYRLPKGEARAKALEEALLHATEVPLACARLAAEVIALSQQAAEKGNKNLLADAQMAALAAFAALKGSVLNVRINAKGLRDPAFAERVLQEVETLLQEAEPKVKAVCALER